MLHAHARSTFMPSTSGSMKACAAARSSCGTRRSRPLRRSALRRSSSLHRSSPGRSRPLRRSALRCSSSLHRCSRGLRCSRPRRREVSLRPRSRVHWSKMLLSWPEEQPLVQAATAKIAAMKESPVRPVGARKCSLMSPTIHHARNLSSGAPGWSGAGETRDFHALLPGRSGDRRGARRGDRESSRCGVTGALARASVEPISCSLSRRCARGYATVSE